MSYGPRAMELGAQLIGRIFKKLLKLDGMRAWRLVLGAWRLVLGACGLLLVAFFRYPWATAHASWISVISLELVLFIILGAWTFRMGIKKEGPDISVLRRRRWGCVETSRLYSRDTCRLDQARDMFLLLCSRSTSTATSSGPVR